MKDMLRNELPTESDAIFEQDIEIHFSFLKSTVSPDVYFSHLLK